MEQDDDDDDDTDDDTNVEDKENEAVIESDDDDTRRKRQRDDDVNYCEDDDTNSATLLEDAKTMSLLPTKLRKILEWRDGMTPGQFILQHNRDKQKLVQRYISFCKVKYDQTIQIDSARTALAKYFTRISESRSYLGCSSGDSVATAAAASDGDSVVGGDSVRGGGKTTGLAWHVSLDDLSSKDLKLFLKHDGMSPSVLLNSKSQDLIIQYKEFLKIHNRRVPAYTTIKSKISRFRNSVKEASTTGTSPRASASVIAEGDMLGGLSSELLTIYADEMLKLAMENQSKKSQQRVLPPKEIPDEINLMLEQLIQKEYPLFDSNKDERSAKIMSDVIKTTWTTANDSLRRLHRTLDDSSEEQVKLILRKICLKVCRQVQSVFPKRATFQLMCSLAKRKKKHFVNEALRALLVMSNQVGVPLVEFLRQGRTLAVRSHNPRGSARPGSRKFTFDYLENQVHFNSFVSRMAASIYLMTDELSSNSEYYFSVSGRSCTHKTKEYNIAMANCSFSERCLGNVTETTSPKSVSFDVEMMKYQAKPMQGTHLPHTFVHTLWEYFRHLDYGVVLFRTIFKSFLTKVNYDYKDIDARAFNMMIEVSSELWQRQAFVLMLHQLASLFPTMEAIKSNSHNIKDLFDNRDTFVNLLAQKYHSLDVPDIIVASYQCISQKIGYKIDTRSRHTSIADNYSIVCGAVHAKWLFFKRQILILDQVKSKSSAYRSRAKTATKTAKQPPTKKLKLSASTSNSNQSWEDIPVPAPTSNTSVPTIMPFLEQLLLKPSRAVTATAPTVTTASIVTAPIATSTAFDFNKYQAEKYWPDKNHIIDGEELRKTVISSLVLYSIFGLYKLQVGSCEIYSAGGGSSGLREVKHGRETHLVNETSVYPSSAVRTIPPTVPLFIDRNNVLHVARAGSEMFNSVSERKPIDIKILARMLMKHGDPDKGRKEGNGRIAEIGIKNEHGSKTICGHNFIEKIESPEDRKHVLVTICAIAQTVWESMKRMNSSAGMPSLCDSKYRDYYPEQVRRYLTHMFSDEDKLPFAFNIPFEWITLSIMLLHPFQNKCVDHFDSKNCLLYAYNRTGCMNFVLKDSEGNIYLVQVLLNFRAAIEKEEFPYADEVKACVASIQAYRDLASKNYKEMIMDKYKGDTSERKMNFVYDSFDTKDFFLDDNISYSEFYLTVNGLPEDIPFPALKVFIPFSRPLSLSSFVSVMYSKKSFLSWDMALELCFMASFLNSPFNFYYIIGNMTKDDLEQNDNHPLLFFLNQSSKLFGCFGGAEPRYSPTGLAPEDLLHLFGNDNCVTLNKVLGLLCGHVNWIDSQKGKTTAQEIPFESLEKQYNTLSEDVRNTVKNRNGAVCTGKAIEFGVFRAQIFTTLITTMSLCLPGKHLHQLMIPLGQQASAKQLEDALKYKPDHVRSGKNPMKKKHFDQAMNYIATHFLIAYYCRNFIESALCEGKSGRINEERNSIFPKGSSLHEINSDGVPILKNYGKYEWDPMSPYNRILRHNIGYKISLDGCLEEFLEEIPDMTNNVEA